MTDPARVEDDPDPTVELEDPISHARGLIALQEIDEDLESLHEASFLALGAPLGTETVSAEAAPIDLATWPELVPRSTRA